jgi:Pyruvate/2-oxoacid:ferredoxin oxidoreductase delta subunit
MMRYGIPKYRLPRDILDAEIERILAMGVTLELNTTAAGSPSTAGGTRPWMPPAPPAGSALRRPSWCTGARGTGCRLTTRRCMSCGNCFGCDNCYGACPDAAILKNTGIIKTGPGGYEIDYEYCKGCGICAAECPSGVIAMVPEET